MNHYRVLIVDDEPAARRGLMRRLQACERIKTIHPCANGGEAVSAMAASTFDLVFLDIQMPGMDGFEVVETLGGKMPPVVFVTAYDAFALRAFEVHALDYLLKPIDKTRFQAAVNRVLDRLDRNRVWEMTARLEAFLGDCRTVIPESEPTLPERLMVRDKGSYFFIDIPDMIYARVEGNYVQIKTTRDEYWIRETLVNLLNKLGSERFLRIARPFLVNREQIRAIHPGAQGSFTLTLAGGHQLKSSRHYQSAIKNFLKTFSS